MLLYLDANVYLSFLTFSADDLGELDKLAEHVEKGTVTLYLPEQTEREFRGNREKKIQEAISKLREQDLHLQYPQIARDYDEYADLRRLQKEFETVHASLVKRLTSDALSQTLRADHLIQRLFGRAKSLETTGVVLQAASARVERGDPPGKRGSLGDAINWEALLAGIPERNHLHFVSDDSDFASPLDRDRLLPVLDSEWSAVNASQLLFYRRLSLFFASNLPKIALSDDGEKAKLIAQLAASQSFAETHMAVARLLAFSEFNATQAENLLSAMESNNQVRWIFADRDVASLARRILHDHAETQLDFALALRVKQLLGDEAPDLRDEDESAPF